MCEVKKNQMNYMIVNFIIYWTGNLHFTRQLEDEAVKGFDKPSLWGSPLGKHGQTEDSLYHNDICYDLHFSSDFDIWKIE